MRISRSFVHLLASWYRQLFGRHDHHRLIVCAHEQYLIRIGFEIIEGLVVNIAVACRPSPHRRTEITYVAFIFLLVHLFGGFVAMSRFSIRVWDIQRSPFFFAECAIMCCFSAGYRLHFK